MRFATKLFLLFAGLLSLAVVGTSLAVWGTHEARRNLARIDLAHRSYEGYLSLSNHTYQLFKQFGDAMTIGDLDQGALETELLAAIRRDIATIRAIIAEEIHLDFDEMVTDLDRLARIENKIQNLLAEYQTVLETDDSVPLTEEWGRLSRILDERVDQDFARLIQEALDIQLEELADQRSLLEARARMNQLLAALVAIFGAIAGAAAFWWLVRDFKKPVGRLIAGAEALARGEREHRIPSGGGSELDGVARALNRMADEIAVREQGLETSNRRLETAVAERTADLERLLATLKDAEASRRRLLADVSHELRTPLTIIRGEADIALRGVDRPSAEYREALTRCRDAATHTTRLVDDLLFIARRESHETRLVLRVLDLATFLPAVLADSRSLLDSHGGSATLHSDVDQAMLRADPDRLRQIFLILLDNAVRHGGGQVTIGLDRIPDGYRISFTDTGPGLGPEDLAQVFQRFFGGSNAARGYESGVGLGLPVAKAIVEAHEGRIGIESRPGEGMTVRVDGSAGRDAVGSGAMNILLVEDEARVADFVQRGLKAEGWSVSVASTGESALVMIADGSFDVIVLDLMLPGISGQDVCRRLRAKKNRTPILMLSALADAEDRVAGLRMGADDYLPKPFDFDELMARIEALARRSGGFTETAASPEVLTSGVLSFDTGSLEVRCGDTPINLTPKERDLVKLFLSSPRKILSRERILSSLWGINQDPQTNVVDVYIGRLRKKLGPCGESIETVRGAGYRYAEDGRG